ncbi:MAG: glycosyltransferase family 2 protein [Candidatus Omnitrophota bacterium]|nr:glycosyltransferase family 2 protein [Candidatus Omnitrophota bacterium]
MSSNLQDSNRIFVSIIIPVYNEEKRISFCLNEVVSYLTDKKLNYEVIVSDDGSIDGTCGIVKDFARTNQNIQLLKKEIHSGKGAAVKNGMLWAKGEFALFMDCDLSVHINELNKFLEYACRGTEIVIGSRRKKGVIIKFHQPVYRIFLGFIFTILSNSVLFIKITDCSCGFKLFNRKAYKNIFEKQILNGWSFDSEILYLARRNRYKIKELPITWQNDEHTKFKLSKDAIFSLLDIFKIRINEMSGKYR